MNRLALTAFALLPLAGCGIIEEDMTGRQVGIIAPADGVQIAAGAVRFAWRGVETASGYELLVVSPSFGRAERIAADTVIRADSVSRGACCTIPLGEGNYEWSVRPFNSAYAGEPMTAKLHVITTVE